jgi:hypothetical protein
MSLLALVLAATGVAHADAPDNWKFKLDGYYRTRGYVFGGLYDGQEKPGTYMQQRLRLQPELNFEDRAKFIMMVDGLDDVVWGDNASLASTSLFAGDPSNANLSGQEIPSVRLKRAWLEFKVPVGLVRVGRQASHWGMGLLANDGNGFDDTFGENHGGNTFDRILFATKPINVATTIAGKPKDVPLIAAIAVDRLVEDPLIQYYGYSCSVENPDDGCDDFDDHGVTEERDAERRTDSWWVDTEDDVWEMVYALNYKGENLKLGNNLVGDITVGGYAIHRLQGETASDVLVLDAYAKTEIAGVLFEGEVVHIGGETRAITLSSGDQADPYFKDADIWGYVVRGGYQNELFTGVLEHGYASGDNDVTDTDFTGRPLHPDHNVGLLLYDEIIARTTAATWGESAAGLWSQGGVYNSRYVFPNVRVRPLKNWEITGAFLAAWPDRPDGANVRCAADDGCTQANASADLLGWEVDAAVKHRFHDHILFSMETGYAHATDRLPLKDANLAYVVNDKGQEVGNYFTFQSRVAYEF